MHEEAHPTPGRRGMYMPNVEDAERERYNNITLLTASESLHPDSVYEKKIDSILFKSFVGGGRGESLN